MRAVSRDLSLGSGEFNLTVIDLRFFLGDHCLVFSERSLVPRDIWVGPGEILGDSNGLSFVFDCPRVLRACDPSKAG